MMIKETRDELKWQAWTNPLVEKARAFACEAHKGLIYNRGYYLENHLDKVVINVLEFYEFDTKYNTLVEILAAAFLHGTVENTDVTLEDLQREFGTIVAHYVDCVTDADGPNKKVRKMLSYSKTRRSSEGVFIKLCDRLANVQAGNKLDMYKAEYYTFKCALYQYAPINSSHTKLWLKLDELLT